MTKTKEQKIKFIEKSLPNVKTVYKKFNGYNFKVSFMNGGKTAIIFNQNLATVTKFNLSEYPLERQKDEDVDFLYQLLR